MSKKVLQHLLSGYMRALGADATGQLTITVNIHRGSIGDRLGMSFHETHVMSNAD